MPVIVGEQQIKNTEMFVRDEDVPSKGLPPPNTVLFELANRPKKFDVRDVVEYIRKYLGDIIDLENGVAVMGARVLALTLKDVNDKDTVVPLLEEMFAKSLEDVRSETGRVFKVIRSVDARI